jgi:hypothetical protein
MSKKADWELAEDEFDHHWKLKGKRAFLFEFKDARYLRGMNKRPTAVGNQPSDRLVTYDGVTFFAEVKYTTHPTRFDFGLLKPGQHGAGIRTVAAGGEYRVYVKSAVHNQWYCIPYQVIQNCPRQSLLWTELETLKVSLDV